VNAAALPGNPPTATNTKPSKQLKVARASPSMPLPIETICWILFQADSGESNCILEIRLASVTASRTDIFMTI
jgi:hypothetical protein